LRDEERLRARQAEVSGSSTNDAFVDRLPRGRRASAARSVAAWSRVSLPSARPGRRPLSVATFATARTGTGRRGGVSARRVAIDALVVT
jgi:hypothetical protein